MELSPDICERARQARDARFDGRFFIGVVTTGVFCRPTCPVQPPKAENVRFFATAAAAGAAGFRPCLRCLPELSPGIRRDAPAPVGQALRLIHDGFLDENTGEQLAAALGVTSRHLARLFRRHVGATPHRVAHTRRLLFAKHLLDQSELPVADIAFAAGFGSVRRFNSAVRETWGRSPDALRRHSAAAGGEGIRLRLAYRPPLDWRGLLAFYAARAIPGVESVTTGDEGCYRRTIDIDGRQGWFAVRQPADGHVVELTVQLPDVKLLAKVVARVRRMFDLDADPLAVAPVLGRDPLLAPVLEQAGGLRVPGAWDPFEIAVRAILGQQISVAAARTLAERLVRTFGERPAYASAEDADRLFPTAEQLAHAEMERCGVTGARARAIRHLARRVAGGDLDLHNAELATQLTALLGIGDWTAQYIALRSGQDPDAFPATDLGLLRAAQEDGVSTPAALRRRAETWRPWRAYAALCLWQRHVNRPLPRIAEY